MYKSNMEKYGSKTYFGTNEFKEWRKEHIGEIMDKMEKTFLEKALLNNFVEIYIL